MNLVPGCGDGTQPMTEPAPISRLTYLVFDANDPLRLARSGLLR